LGPERVVPPKTSRNWRWFQAAVVSDAERRFFTQQPTENGPGTDPFLRNVCRQTGDAAGRARGSDATASPELFLDPLDLLGRLPSRRQNEPLLDIRAEVVNGPKSYIYLPISREAITARLDQVIFRSALLNKSGIESGPKVFSTYCSRMPND
jgi:hypothetical protein